MNETQAIDPVCGMAVHYKRWTTLHQSREYAFCAEGCQAVFEQDPVACLSKGERQHYDLVIVGGGPAGMTAAVYASLQQLHTLLLCKDLGGQAVDTRRIKNYTGYDLISGPELLGSSGISCWPRSISSTFWTRCCASMKQWTVLRCTRATAAIMRRPR